MHIKYNEKKSLAQYKNEDGYWRITVNCEQNEIIANAVRFIKKQKNSLAGSRDVDGRQGNP